MTALRRSPRRSVIIQTRLAHKTGCSTDQCWDNVCDIVHNYSRENPANTRHKSDDGFMLVQRRRRWASLKPALRQCLVFAGKAAIPSKLKTSTRCCFYVGPLSATLAQCKANTGSMLSVPGR